MNKYGVYGMYGKYGDGDHRLLGTVVAKDSDAAKDEAYKKYNTGIPESGLPQGIVVQQIHEDE